MTMIDHLQLEYCLKSNANVIFLALDEGDIELLKTYVSNFAQIYSLPLDFSKKKLSTRNIT